MAHLLHPFSLPLKRVKMAEPTMSFEYLVKFLIQASKDKNQPEVERLEKAILDRYRKVVISESQTHTKMHELKMAIKSKAMAFSKELMALK